MRFSLILIFFCPFIFIINLNAQDQTVELCYSTNDWKIIGEEGTLCNVIYKWTASPDPINANEINDPEVAQPSVNPKVTTTYTRTTYDLNGNILRDQKQIVVKVIVNYGTLKGVGFKNDHTIHKWPTDGTLVTHNYPAVAIDFPDGSEFVWDDSGINDPVCYTKASIPEVFFRINLCSNQNDFYDIRITEKNTNKILAEEYGIVGATVLNLDNINLFNSVLPDKVDITILDLEWEMKLTSKNTWSTVGSSKITIYTTYDKPLNPPFKGYHPPYFEFNQLYDRALEWACQQRAGIEETLVELNTVSVGVNTDYEPFTSIGYLHPLHAYDTGGACQCSEITSLLHGQLRSIGIDVGDVLTVLGAYNQELKTPCLYLRPSLNNNDAQYTFQIERPQVGSGFNITSEKDPHFVYHTFVKYNNKYYDPSYAIINITDWKSDILETHPEAVLNEFTGVYNPVPFYWVSPTWECPH